ncbi:MAG: hypothetical protein ACRD12_10990 [Acidimicrobiales bacterium]
MTDERPQDALAHLQAAASELIAAARVVLDMAEDLVSQSIKLVGEGTRSMTPPPPVEKIEVVREDPPGAG